MTTSHHSPLKLSITKAEGYNKRPFQFERAWLTNHKVIEMVNKTCDEFHASSIYLKTFLGKMALIRSKVNLWSSHRYANFGSDLKKSKICVKALDHLEEIRNLTPDESKLRLQLREQIYELSQIQESK